jgi:hypothetical protein
MTATMLAEQRKTEYDGKGRSIYIAGPMSGIPAFNFPAFDEAERILREFGWNPINPAEMDREIGFDPNRDTVDKAFLEAAMARDVAAITEEAEAMVMLPGWERSTGAKAEKALADWKHIPVYQWPEMTLISGKSEVPSKAITESDGLPQNMTLISGKFATPTETGTKSGGLPKDATERKQTPIASGVLDYFPRAIAAIAHCSKVGNDQHNPGQPLHWDRTKSTDEADCLIRHFMERGTIDTDGVRHSTKCAWRSLSLLEKELEAASQH